ncbi:MAG TPA: hypothetical protein VGM37_01315 [Armatimonadota bacterium]|jgi:hypothetical protein
MTRPVYYALAPLQAAATLLAALLLFVALPLASLADWCEEGRGRY